MGKHKEEATAELKSHDSSLGPRPFDTAFKTLRENCTDLLIPVINEVFRTHYGLDDDILLLSEGQQVKDEKGKRTGREMDSHILLDQEMYHIECQTNRDYGMALRMLEYDFHTALSNAQKRDGIYEIRDPKSAVLHLRNQSDVPDCYQVRRTSADGKKTMYTVPVLKVQSYGKNELFDKKLLFLIPFYTMRFERRMVDINSDPRKLALFKRECQDIYDRLARLHAEREIDGRCLGILVEMTEGIIGAVTKNAENVWKEVADMGGYVKKTLTDKLIEYGEIQGIEKGMEQQIAAGIARTMVKQKLSYEDACDYEDVPHGNRDKYRGKVEEELKKISHPHLTGQPPHRTQSER